MGFKKYGNLYTGVFFLIFTIIYATQIPHIRITSIGHINAAAYPKVLAVVLGALSILQICIAALALKSGGAAVTSEEGEKKSFWCVLLSLTLSITYVALLQPLGFLISSVFYVFFQIIVLCPKDEVKLIKFAVISISSASIVYFTFRNVLNLMLPAGPLAGIF